MAHEPKFISTDADPKEVIRLQNLMSNTEGSSQKILDPCTCGGPDGEFANGHHRFGCPSIRASLLHKKIKNEKELQKDSGLIFEKGARLNEDVLSALFNTHRSDPFPMPMDNDEASVFFRSIKNIGPFDDYTVDPGCYLISHTEGGESLEGIVTSVLYLKFDNDGYWSITHAWSPACKTAKDLYDVLHPSS